MNKETEKLCYEILGIIIVLSILVIIFSSVYKREPYFPTEEIENIVPKNRRARIEFKRYIIEETEDRQGE